MSAAQPTGEKAAPHASLISRFTDRLPRTLRPTRAGKYLLGIAMAMGFAAMNTGNNLLFLAWGLVLGSIIVSGLLSESTLRILRVRSQKQAPAFARESAHLSIVLDNVSARVSAYAVRLAMRFSHNDDEAEAKGYVLRAAPGGAQEATTQLTFPHRGVWSLDRTYVRTQFPFGFFEKSRWFETRGQSDVLVFPARVSVRVRTETFRPRTGTHQTTQRGRGDEYFSLRPYRESDDVRHVHWKKSARRGRLMVQEYARETDDDVVIGLLTAGPGDAAERAIEVVAAVCAQLLEAGRPVGLAVPGRVVLPDAGTAQLLRIRTALALCDVEQPLALTQIPAGTPVVAIRASDAPAVAGLTSVSAEAIS